MHNTALRWYLAACVEALFLILPFTSLHAQFAGGIYTIGDVNNGDQYTTIKEAFDDVNGKDILGPVVFEISQNYQGEGGTPVTIDIAGITGTSAQRTVTVRPRIGVSVVTEFDPGADQPLFRVIGCSFITFDGRPGGTGTVGGWLIRNTNTTNDAGPVLLLTGDASFDSLRFLQVEGSARLPGLVRIDGRGGSAGCTGIVVRQCEIGGDRGQTMPLPWFGIVSVGDASAPNTAGAVEECNIHDVFNPDPAERVSDAGVYLAGGNSGWRITGCSVYQSDDRTATSSDTLSFHTAIAVVTEGDGFSITGNWVGGSGSQCNGDMVLGPTVVEQGFIGILLDVGGPLSNTIEGNTISNIVLATSSTRSEIPGAFAGIHLAQGRAVIADNTIGSSGLAGSLLLTSEAPTAASMHGIASSAAGAIVSIIGNTVSGIRTSTAGSGAGMGIRGIVVFDAGEASVSGNVIGSDALTRGIQAGDEAPVGSAPGVSGIICADIPVLSVHANTIRHLFNAFDVPTEPLPRTCGILVDGCGAEITSNSISGLDAYGTAVSTAGEAAICGIAVAGAGSTLMQGNAVSQLHGDPSGGMMPIVVGIELRGTGATTVARNLVHSFGSQSDDACLTGIRLSAAPATVVNNRIRLGVDVNGGSACGGAAITGIRGSGMADTIAFNSVFIGGVVGGGVAGGVTTALHDSASSLDAVLVDNILQNKRGGGGSGAHTAIIIDGAPGGMRMDHNVYCANGASLQMFGFHGTTPIAALKDWQGEFGMDASSLEGDPRFSDATGPALPGCLTVALGNPLDPLPPSSNGGIPLPGITGDFSGTPRSVEHPDIGSHEFFIARPALVSGTLPGGRLDILSHTTAGRQITLGGDLVIDSLWRIDAGSCSIGAHSVTVNGTLDVGGGTLIGGVTSRVVIAGPGASAGLPALTLHTLVLDRPRGMDLHGDLIVRHSLQLLSGALRSNGWSVTVGASGAEPGFINASDGHLDGVLKCWIAPVAGSTWQFPVGDSTHARSMTLHFTTAPSPGTLAVRFHPVYPGTAGLPLNDGGTWVTNVGMAGYWQMLPGDGLLGGSYDMDLQASFFGGVMEPSSLRILTRTPSGAWFTQGQHAAGTGTLQEPIAHRLGMAGYGEVGIGGTAINPLPVELVAFGASLVAGVVQLRWRTAMEVNNMGFAVEAAPAADSVRWRLRGFVPGNGTTWTPRDYAFTDDPLDLLDPDRREERVFYRLRQIDRDGTETVSATRTVRRLLPGRGIIVALHPNPAHGDVVATVAVPDDTPGRVRLMNALGTEVWSAQNLPSGTQFVTLPTRSLPAGMYRIEVSTPAHTDRRTLIVVGGR